MCVCKQALRLGCGSLDLEFAEFAEFARVFFFLTASTSLSVSLSATRVILTAAKLPPSSRALNTLLRRVDPMHSIREYAMFPPFFVFLV